MRLLPSCAFKAPVGRSPSGVAPGEAERCVETWLDSKGERTTDGRGVHINVHGGFERWTWDISFDPTDFADILRKASRSYKSAPSG